MATRRPTMFRPMLLGTATCALLAACNTPLDFDMRGRLGGLDTSGAAIQASAPRPAPDARGVISYPTYQVAVAQRGDTVASVANRVGLPAQELAAYNGIPLDVALRQDEIVALPRRVAEPAGGPVGGGAITPAGAVDVTTLAGNAIDRAGGGGGASPAPVQTAAIPPAAASTPATAVAGEPIRHKVATGETAYSIARAYNVTVKDLAEWNGLGTDLALREGQYLLIPVASGTPPARPAVVEEPGAGSATPVPPSAAEPLPAATAAAAAAPKDVPASPNLGAQRSDSAGFALPVGGPIIRDFDKGKSAFVLFQAGPGTPVKAAQQGTVKLISKNADGVEIMVVDHGGGLQSAYSFITGIAVKKGDKVSKGQTIAKVAQNEFGALQFMVFKGTQTVDPAPYFK